MMRPLILSTLTVLAFALPAGAQTPAPPVPDTQPVPQPPEAKTTPLQIYASLNGQQAGPFSEQTITKMAAKGQINAQTLVWSGELNMTGWQPAGQVPAIAALLKTASPLPGPLPGPGPGPLPDRTDMAFDPVAYMRGGWISEDMVYIPELNTSVPCQRTAYFHPDGRATGGCSFYVPLSPGMPPATGDMSIDGYWTAETAGEGRIVLRGESNVIRTLRLPDGRFSTQTIRYAEPMRVIVLSQDRVRVEETGTIWSRSR